METLHCASLLFRNELSNFITRIIVGAIVPARCHCSLSADILAVNVCNSPVVSVPFFTAELKYILRYIRKLVYTWLALGQRFMLRTCSIPALVLLIVDSGPKKHVGIA